MKRSLLVQTLLDMATGSGGAKLEALVVDAAGTFDAGSGKGYNPVTVPSGSINVLGEKGVVSNNSVVVTPKAQVVGGWLNGGETSGSGVGVTASELVSGTLNVSSDGVQDVTNYQNISVPSAGHSASASKSAVVNNSITVTPRSTATRGFVQEGTVEGVGVSVSASELVSGDLNIDSDGVYDVTNYKNVNVVTGAETREELVDIAQPVTLRANVGVTISSFTPSKEYKRFDIEMTVQYQSGTATTHVYGGLSNALKTPALCLPGAANVMVGLTNTVRTQSVSGSVYRGNYKEDTGLQLYGTDNYTVFIKAGGPVDVYVGADYGATYYFYLKIYGVI